MLADGATIEGMMRELGCTRPALYQARRALGLQKKFPTGPRPIDDEKVAALTRLGWTKREIAREMGYAIRTIERSRARTNRASR